MSSDAISILPPLVASQTSVVLFRPEREGLKEVLLDSFLHLHNPKTSLDRQLVREEIHNQAVKLLNVEKELVNLLVIQERGQIIDSKDTKALLLQNKTHDDAQEGCVSSHCFLLM